MIPYRFSNGDELTRSVNALIVRFSGRRKVLSTASWNGGYREDLKWVFNQDCKINGDKLVPLKAPTYGEHMRIVAEELGLDPKYACGLSTAASMDNVSVISETYSDTTVTAVVTGGIDENGGRVGDPAFWHETEGDCTPANGTINIMLLIDADLPEGTLTRALVTCTEAKTAALQELLAPSLYSSGIATGSGTDGTIIVSNAESPVRLNWAGKHAKLGELIGRTVITAVKEALYRQTGLDAVRQFDVFSRAGRYGITRQRVLEQADVRLSLDDISKRPGLVVFTSLYIHLLDQLSWGMIGAQDALLGAGKLLQSMGFERLPLPSGIDSETAMKLLLDAYLSAFTRFCHTQLPDD
jgi:adenosylcobinamide hydrolase